MGRVQTPAIASGFLHAAERVPNRPALEVDGSALTYSELRRRALAIAYALASNELDDGPPLTAVFANRTPTAFAGVLGALLRGHGYVPLNPRFPVERNRELLARSGCRAVVVDSRAVDMAAEVLAGLQRPLLLVIPDGPRVPDRGRWAPHRVVGAGGAEDGASLPEPRAEDPAYLLFTSGSTGRPKGVLVRQANVRAFLDAIAARYDLDENDRLSQLFDLTFDLSVFDMFAAWEHGACVCCPTATDLLKPSSFVRAAGVTVWFSVPSAAMFLQHFGALKTNAFPTLRLSLFCGEALPAGLARAWAVAAPGSAIENLYGPTEATVACTAHRWEPDAASAGQDALVPIGEPLGTTSARIVDESLRTVPAGEPGELLLSGPQVVDGYWDDDEATARAFVSLPDLGNAYRTGDRVVQPDEAGPLLFLGRFDTQVKVLGHRVELEEVEAIIRDEASVDAVAVGWPRTAAGAAGIVAFVAGDAVDVPLLRRRLEARLPDYMVPREVRVVSDLPLNANGKRDRNAVVALLEER